MEGSTPKNRNPNYFLNFKTKPTLDEEEIFDGQSTFGSQYRFDTTEDDLVN